MSITRTISHVEDGQRLERLLKQWLPALSFGMLQRWLRKGEVRVNGKRVKGNMVLQKGDEVRLPPQSVNFAGKQDVPSQPAHLVADAPNWLVAETETYFVFNKPAGLPSQAGSKQTTSLDRITAQVWPETPPKLVHRLDKETTGLILMAKTTQAAKTLATALQERACKKTYLALVAGKVTTPGWVQAPLAKISVGGEMKMAISESGEEALTQFAPLAYNAGDDVSLIALAPVSGRMHQLRVHMAALNHPLVNDAKYKGPKTATFAHKTFYLHAWQLTLKNGSVYTAPLPPHWQEVVQEYKWQIPPHSPFTNPPKNW